MKLSFALSFLLILFAGGVWADGPQDPDAELAKKQINECSDGITQTWTYLTKGYIFHGKNLDLECVETLKGLPSYDDEKDNFIFKDNLFWFFIDEWSIESSVQEAPNGVVATSHDGRMSYNFHIKNVFQAKSQDEIKVTELWDGAYYLYEDYYISKSSKGSISSKGGTFWYDTKRNYDNEIIELLDAEYATKIGLKCVSPEQIIKNHGMSIEKIKERINLETGLSKSWLAALTYHKRATWCYSR